MHKTRQLAGFAIGLVALLGIGVPSAHATVITFDFNSLSDGASNTAIQTYMNGILGAAGTVTVTGARGEKDYNGDNHVVGAGGVSQTLGPDTFITNVGGGSSPDDRVVMKFSFPIYNVSFDFEIFPDSTCTSLGHCGTGNANIPDFKFMAGPVGSTVLVTPQPWVGKVPGSPGGSVYLHSPDSGAINNELTPQLLGVSGTWLFPGGVKELDFIDWPQKIGIDNLRVNEMPEPSTLLLLGSGLVGVARTAWKKRS